jgi:hypothetical protein
MTDLEILHDAWDPPAAPSHTARLDARTALLARAARRSDRRRRRAVTLAVAAVTVAVAVAATNLDGSGPDGLRGVPLASAEVLERAAAAAEQKPFTAPRDDQWVYFEDRLSSSHWVETHRQWRRADGGGIAFIDERGKLQVELIEPPRGRPRPPLDGGYKELAALPTDPDALLRWAYGLAENITGAGLTDHGDVYAIFNGMLRGNVMPPKLEAAIFRALKQVPGVELTTVEVLGRPAYSLGQTEDWLREELLLDRETYTYLGERSTIARDATINPLKAGNRTGEVRKGDKVVATRIETAIVDRPGERP